MKPPMLSYLLKNWRMFMLPPLPRRCFVCLALEACLARFIVNRVEVTTSIIQTARHTCAHTYTYVLRAINTSIIRGVAIYELIKNDSKGGNCPPIPPPPGSATEKNGMNYKDKQDEKYMCCMD